MIRSVAIGLLFLTQGNVNTTVGVGAFGGRILSPDGTPAAGVRVAAVPSGLANSSPLDSALLGITQTDDSGRYRLDGLPPGQYRIVAGLLELLTYYPGVKDGETATILQVTSNSTKTGLDFTLQNPNGLRVRGRVTQTDPRVPLPQSVTMIGAASFQQRQAAIAPDGSFEFHLVPPGNYQIRISPSVVGVQAQQVDVKDKDVDGLEFALPLITTISGRVITEDGSPIPRLTIAIVGAQGKFTRGLTAEGAFAIRVPEGDQKIVVGGLSGGYELKSILLGSTDLIREPLKAGKSEVRDVIVTLWVPPPDLRLRISGRVTRPESNPGLIPSKVILSGRPMPDSEAMLSKDGSFEFPSVPPGTYSVAVLGIGGPPVVMNVNAVNDITGLVIAIPRQFEITGRVVMEPQAPVPQFEVRSTDRDGKVTRVFAGKGIFRIVLEEGEYRFSAQGVASSNLPAGYYVKSMQSGSIDLLTKTIKISSDATAPEIVLTLGVKAVT